MAKFDPSAWIKKYYRGSFADRIADPECLVRLFEYAWQFGIIATDGEAEDFLKSTSGAITKASFAATLNIESAAEILRDHAEKRGKKFPKAIRRPAPASSPRLAARTAKARPAGLNYVEEAIAFGLCFGLLPQPDDPENFAAQAKTFMEVGNEVRSLAQALGDYSGIGSF
jgi:hypothetical protein